MHERTGPSQVEAIQQARLWAENLHILGIQALLFDLDDTLIATTESFHDTIAICAEMIAFQTEKSITETTGKILAASEQAYATEYVNPHRWATVMETVLPQHPTLRQECLRILDTLYTFNPPLKPGADITLSVLRHLSGMDITTAIVTHANQAWTEIKVKKLRLDDYFSRICVISENGPKGPDEWLEQITGCGLTPRRAAIIGDSLKSDIIPADLIGAGLLVWINGGTTWDFYQRGKVPERTIVVPEIGNVVEALTHRWALETRPEMRAVAQSGPYALLSSDLLTGKSRT